MFNVKINLKFNASVTFNLWFKANSNRKILGKFHIYFLRLTFLVIILYIGSILI